jgi:hypothetical protein
MGFLLSEGGERDALIVGMEPLSSKDERVSLEML